VHALRHVHQLLVPGGTMLDLHPVTEEHAEDSRGRHIGVLADPEYADEDLPNAEARLEQAVVAGLYAPEAEVEFEVLQHYDEADELLEAKAERFASQQELARRVRNATAPLRLREHVVLRRYRAC
jgi:hypothetical protein